VTSKLVLASVVLALLAACGEREVILPGERFDVRAQTQSVNRAAPVALPAASVNDDWGHRNGGPSHSISHPALGQSLTQLFETSIGTGDTKRARITSDPVVAGGIVYTVDAKALVTATTLDGARVWQRDVTPAGADAGDAFGGSISVSDGGVYVTSGYGEISALDAATGDVRWVQDLDAPAFAAPTVRGDLIYLVARDSTAWALNASNGRVQWQQAGVPSTGSFGSGASPAVQGEYVIFPFPSGQVLATYPLGGIVRWSSVVTGDRLGNVTLVSDISGDPVIVGNRVYIGNFGGRTTAFNLDDGTRVWTAAEGALSPVWVVGDALFLINDINELVRLDTNTGEPVWRVPMPTFTNDRRTRNQRSVFTHYGPILAGGRLIVASSDGVIRQFDPTSGASLGDITLPGGAASAPVVAQQTLYVLSKTGQLHAFR